MSNIKFLESYISQIMKCLSADDLKKVKKGIPSLSNEDLNNIIKIVVSKKNKLPGAVMKYHQYKGLMSCIMITVQFTDVECQSNKYLSIADRVIYDETGLQIISRDSFHYSLDKVIRLAEDRVRNHKILTH